MQSRKIIGTSKLVAGAAAIARQHMDVVTTSGVATGVAADIDKIDVFRESCSDTPLAVPSGVTPDNAADYMHRVDCILVATGINVPGDFYNIDEVRLRRLINRQSLTTFAHYQPESYFPG